MRTSHRFSTTHRPTFEQEYAREEVLVHPLGPLTPLSYSPAPSTSISSSLGTATAASTDDHVVPLHAPALPPLDSLPPPLAAQTYIYAGPLRDLAPELWSYEDFVRKNAWKWVGRGAMDDNYVEVDRRREMYGKTLKTEILDTTSMPDTESESKSGGRDEGKTVVVEID